MGKISKEDAKKHQRAMDLIHSDRPLTLEEKWFVIDNYNEAATNMNAVAGAFFTPVGLASDFCLELREERTIDLCAGIGILSFVAFHRDYIPEMVCVELNPEYVGVGKRILPEADWILGDVTDQSLMTGLGKFKQAMSNPPFGRIKAGDTKWAGYVGSEFEYKAIAVASKIAEYGAFILPQNSTPFTYSSTNQHQWDNTNAKMEAFIKQTGLEFEFNVGIDTSAWKDDWNGVSPTCEIATFDFTQKIGEATLF